MPPNDDERHDLAPAEVGAPQVVEHRRHTQADREREPERGAPTSMPSGEGTGAVGEIRLGNHAHANDSDREHPRPRRPREPLAAIAINSGTTRPRAIPHGAIPAPARDVWNFKTSSERERRARLRPERSPRLPNTDHTHGVASNSADDGCDRRDRCPRAHRNPDRRRTAWPRTNVTPMSSASENAGGHTRADHREEERSREHRVHAANHRRAVVATSGGTRRARTARARSTRAGRSRRGRSRCARPGWRRTRSRPRRPAEPGPVNGLSRRGTRPTRRTATRRRRRASARARRARAERSRATRSDANAGSRGVGGTHEASCATSR